MYAELALDRQVCFALHAAARATTSVYRPLLDELGLTYPQYLVLLALWEHDGQQVGELCTRLALDTGTVSPLLKRLAASGLIERQRLQSDERRVAIHLTEAGRNLQDRAVRVPRSLAQASNLPAEELVALRESLVRLTNSIRDFQQTKEEQ
ncbi:MarR family transcriptional regulator [Aldersonia sp. NBC_00410]|uniref:MarR family winged helix-turn-helix transcriptional regulator n=1 Tax=Aldersonia sp. NBC_00410 TaxID=2975954 RepID=UPI00225BF9AF|nr:MarR family transcriptional regulator [Aldersonia sp. NBC_00410]MCX5043522.1 MarR family transcriptional regulator [Aldersonia sp. NBC_00410]